MIWIAIGLFYSRLKIFFHRIGMKNGLIFTESVVFLGCFFTKSGFLRQKGEIVGLAVWVGRVDFSVCVCYFCM